MTLRCWLVFCYSGAGYHMCGGEYEILGCTFAQQLLEQVLSRRRSWQQQLLLMQFCSVKTVRGDTLRQRPDAVVK